MEEYFNSLAAVITAAGLDPADYRLVAMDSSLDGTPDYVDYPAMWYYYSLVGMTPKEALLVEYPTLSDKL